VCVDRVLCITRMILRLRSGLVSGVVEKRERHLCVMVVPLRDVGRLVLHSPCGRACAGSLRNGTVKKGSGRACALPGVSQRPGKRLSAQRHHTTNSSIQAARDPSHARDFADGARLSQSCTRLPRTRFNGRISEWHRKRSLIGASAQQVFSALFVDERTSVSSTVHDMRCDQTHERLTACFYG
jgi:hypothetical protein